MRYLHLLLAAFLLCSFVSVQVHAEQEPTMAMEIGGLYATALVKPDNMLKFVLAREQALDRHPGLASCMGQLAEAWDQATRMWSPDMPPDLAGRLGSQISS